MSTENALRMAIDGLLRRACRFVRWPLLCVAQFVALWMLCGGGGVGVTIKPMAATSRKGPTMTKKITLYSILATPFVFAACAALAYAQRGYFAFGGEYLALLLPLYVRFACAVVENA